jgi:hypothetical protein
MKHDLCGPRPSFRYDHEQVWVLVAPVLELEVVVS